MSETKTDRAMVEEAKRVIDGIVSEQRNSDTRLKNLDKKVDGMMKAHRLLTESVQTTPVPAFGGDSRLKTFVRSDGSLQWTTESKQFKIPGSGSVTSTQEGLLDSVPANDWHQDLQAIARKRAFARMIMASPHTPKTDLELYKHLDRAPSYIKPAIEKAYWDNAGDGGEWIPDQWVPELTETFKVPRALRALFPEVEVDRATILLPRLVRGGRPYRKGAVSSDSPADYTASTVSTAQTSVTIRGLAVRYILDDSAVEDTAINLMSTLGKQIAEDLEAGFEDCMINGDTSAVHQDALATWNIRGRWGGGGLGGASSHRRLFNGFRRESVIRGTSNTAGTPAQITLAELIGELGRLGELAVQNLILVCSPEFMVKQLMGITQLQTIDQFGAQATLLTGQVGSIMNVPVIMSRFMGADLNLIGFYTGVGTQTGFCLVNRDSYSIFNRRGILVETDKNISAGAIEMVSTMRAVMQSTDAATATNVVYNYNFDSV